MSKRKIILVLALVLLFSAVILSYWVVGNRVERKESFFDAIIGGNVETVRKFLINDPAFISIRDGKGKGGIGSPALHVAVRHCHKDIVELLLSKGANQNDKVWGQAALHQAARMGDAKLIELLLKYGADVNAATNGCLHTPLCFAKNKEAAEMLIANGADVSWRDKYGGTVLHSIARLGLPETVDVLLENDIDINAESKDGSTPLHVAAVRDRKEMVELLIAKGANIDAKDKSGFTPLGYAMKRVRLCNVYSEGVAEFLISLGAKYMVNDVAWLGDLTKVRELLESNPALVNFVGRVRNWETEPVLFSAIRGGHCDVVELFLDKGAKLDIRGTYREPALHAAAHAGHRAVVQVLLERGVDVNQKGAYGELALHWAAAKGHVEVSKLLLERGSQVNVKIQETMRDIDILIGDEPDVIKRALENLRRRESQRQAALAGRSVQIVVWGRLAFSEGDTPLHSATQWGHEEIVKMLLSGGAEVNIENHRGQMSLHYACVFRHKEIAEMLLGAGADANAKDNNGHTPLGLASFPKGDPAKDIVELLLAKGAQE